MAAAARTTWSALNVEVAPRRLDRRLVHVDAVDAGGAADGPLVGLAHRGFVSLLHEPAAGAERDQAKIYDREFAAHMTEVFEADLEKAEPYDYAKWEARPWTEKFAEIFIIPIRSQL